MSVVVFLVLALMLLRQHQHEAALAAVENSLAVKEIARLAEEARTERLLAEAKLYSGPALQALHEQLGQLLMEAQEARRCAEEADRKASFLGGVFVRSASTAGRDRYLRDRNLN